MPTTAARTQLLGLGLFLGIFWAQVLVCCGFLGAVAACCLPTQGQVEVEHACAASRAAVCFFVMLCVAKGGIGLFGACSRWLPPCGQLLCILRTADLLGMLQGKAAGQDQLNGQAWAGRKLLHCMALPGGN